ncbi:transcription-repair coupling factor [Rubrivivax benzoatilyticus]|uniref:Transcription-repair-coupling factor n=1 Tax=Rubrivivax benzoatilyticus TaxID=316997 RepID=A0ABX0HTI8_9BURK|nr:transcription-repair coupling factor [Rubrivivax benzoatilyticus]EGJ09335.1 transcription-repair coupling factor [Rubrivivax benzoatilyticus JA2 = ATCC BAA-35]NHK98346.1 transcription-repair coupling factor [Rubrivivax benzoatilyticus]NHL23879.1 transcription-repair coupling factor [Rubrivivax benzoatilyticus]
MQIPNIAPGKRYTLPRPVGSADALLLARLGAARQAEQRLLAVVTADPADTTRLAEELKFFEPGLRVAVFPDWETLPYDTFSPHQDLISERLATLWRVQQGEVDVVLMPATTALVRLAPPSFMAGYTFHFKQKARLDEAKLKSQLTLAGYQHVSQVVSPGEYAVRGGLIDLYPMGSPVPYRVDLFGDEVDSIRTFDPDSQRSLYPVPEVRLLPGREFPMDEAARTAFRARWREKLDGDPTRSRIYKDIAQGIATGGIEYYLPLFFDEIASIFDYLGETAAVALHGEVDQALERFWTDTRERHRFLQHDPERPLLPPEAIFLRPDEFFARTQPHATLALRGQEPVDWARPLPDLAVDRGAQEPLAGLERHLKTTPHRVLLAAESEGRRESLLELLRDHRIALPSVADLAEFLAGEERFAIVAAPLAQGFHWHEPEAGVSVQFVTETELFATAPQARRRRKQEQTSNVDALIKDLSELKLGDPVVHMNHGIGRYRGLVNIDTGEGPSEFLHLEYADKATLYVPVAQLHLISRYTGVSADEAPLHKLGSGQWDKARRKAAEQVRDTAAELLNLYARRAAREGYAHRYSPADYEAFAASFGFEETPDQRAAIHAVIQDLVSPRPMDRLVCGDVGFGKTEVALRAAFVSVIGGKQVALLAPTTLLAEQHYQTLVDRFGKWPVKIAELSRFRSAKEVKAALEGLADGTVDIVVGTHKLLSQDVRYKRLGLLIIDEEHRFGVRHKEAIKAMRAEVDVLTLTATPIPRTLGMALEGLRDLSVIATAPQRRLAIKTFVRSENNSTIREAVLRELKRGGQVYFLHNDVESIQARRQKLEELLPEARIGVAHGQMPERELEHVMRDFVAQRHNILLCSTIIETGIDVPTANTIVISRADKFGLAQLHQLRGRVGRSHHQAYAYLLVPDVEALTKQAAQRLEAIQQMEELGSGFYLAMHDLEIRGAGEVLGENQSGNMMEVGFQLYNDMLSEAVRSLKAGKEPDLLSPLSATTEINLHAPALLPDAYCGDVQTRLNLYKRLATAEKAEQIDTLLEEITDRFGKLPAQGQTLFDTHRLRVLARPYGVQKIDAGPKVMNIVFRPNPPIEPLRIIELVQKNRAIKLAGNDKLRIDREIAGAQDRAQYVRDVLRALGQPRPA